MAAPGTHRTRVVVTDASSFLGYRIARRLAERGCEVTGIVMKPYRPLDALHQSRLESAQRAGVTIKLLDVTDRGQLLHFIAAERPSAWVYHAGQAEHAGELSILYEALKHYGCGGVVVTGSGDEYSSLPFLCFEEDGCWPLLPSGLSKLAVTIRAFQLAQQYELPTRVARVFIPYGPLDDADKLVPIAVQALSAGRPMDLTPCLQQRDFLHIDDVADGYWHLIADLRNRDSLFDVFNLCGGEGVAVRKLLMRIAALMQADPKLLRFGSIALPSGEVQFLAGSNDKAKALLKWNPRSLDEGLISYLREAGVV